MYGSTYKATKEREGKWTAKIIFVEPECFLTAFNDWWNSDADMAVMTALL